MLSVKQAFKASLGNPSLEDATAVDPRLPNVILGNSQSLFVSIPSDNPEIRRYRLFIDEFEASNSVVHQIHNCLLGAGDNDLLEIRMNNNGGDSSEGLRLINIMENQFLGRTTTIIEYNALSMAALIFCMGTERVIHEGSRLMFHNYFTIVGGKGGELIDAVEINESSRDQFYDIIVKAGYLTEDEYKRMLDGKDIWLGKEELCKRGIATHVMTRGKKVPV